MCALNYCPFLKSTFLVFLIHIGHSNSIVHHLTTIKKQSSPFERLTKLYFYKYLNRKDIFPFPLERQSAGVSYYCSQVGKYFQGHIFFLLFVIHLILSWSVKVQGSFSGRFCPCFDTVEW
jgi:hypothetical protein